MQIKKLTQQQYYELQAQYDRTPSPFEPYGGSGEHLILCVLLRRFGYYEENKIAAWKLTEKLLEAGYDTCGHNGQDTKNDVRERIANHPPRLFETEYQPEA